MSLENFHLLETEARNPRTEAMDLLPTLDLVQLMHSENAAVLTAVEATLPTIAEVVVAIAERIANGGRLFYVGAGTSGRLGVLDASECPPTFGTDASLVQGIIAGGTVALTTSIEGAEDSPETGAFDLRARGVTDKDFVVGIAASGRTPYVIGALDSAREVGAKTAALVNVSNSVMSRHADFVLAAVTGAEVLTGSTRLKAGTAQKLILNLLSTAAMVRIGKVYGNLMIDVKATNVKLKNRAIRIVCEATGAPFERAQLALEEADGNVKVAIVMLKLNITPAEAEWRLIFAKGWVREALSNE